MGGYFLKGRDGERNEPRVVSKSYDLALWILPHVAKMPRDHRFTPGERIGSSAVAFLEHLGQANYTQRREPYCSKPSATSFHANVYRSHLFHDNEKARPSFRTAEPTEPRWAWIFPPF